MGDLVVFSDLNDFIKYYLGLITQLRCFKAAWEQVHPPTRAATVGAQSTMGDKGKEESFHTSPGEAVQGHRHAEWHRCPR